MNYTIRQCTIDSYQDVFKLWQQSDGVGLGDSDSEENIRIFLERNPGTSFIATKDSRVVGTILGGHDGRRGYIHHLAVAQDSRQQGIGRNLVERCLEGFQNRGITKCHILVFRKNEKGRKFWEALGWTNRDDIGVLSTFIQ